MRYLTIFCLAFLLLSCDDLTKTDDVTPQQRIDSAEQCGTDYKEAIEAGNNTEALQAAEQQISISERIDYSQGIADGHCNKASVLISQGNYLDATNELHLALSTYELMNNDSGEAKCNSLLSIVSMYVGNYSDALHYGEKALEIHEAMKDEDGISLDMNNLGVINMSSGNYTAAKALFAQRVGRERSNGDSIKVARALHDIGGAYTESGDAEQGLEFHRQAINAIEELDVNGDPKLLRLLVNIKLSMAGEFFLRNDYSEAIRSGEDGMRLAQQAGDQAQLAYAYKTLAEIYGLTGREDIQLQYLEKYTLLNDTLRTTEFTQRLVEMEYKYSTIKQEAELKEAQAEIQKMEYQQKNSILLIALFVAGGLALVFFVALLIVAISKSRARRNIY